MTRFDAYWDALNEQGERDVCPACGDSEVEQIGGGNGTVIERPCSGCQHQRTNPEAEHAV